MAEIFRSSAFAAKEELTEGTLVAPAAGDFVPIREGFSFQGNIETVESDEFQSDIGSTKSYIGKESPSGSLPKYYRHSGTEGVAPEYSVMIKSALGNQDNNSTEYAVAAGSNAGDEDTRGFLEMGSDEEDNFKVGQGILIKDAVNGYSVRNVYNVDSAGDKLDLSFNIANAPAAGVNLGKSIFFYPTTGVNLPTYSAHHYQAGSAAAFYQAMAGCRTTNMAINFPANDLAEINFDFEGIKHFFNPITITAANKSFDLDEGAAEINAEVSEGIYNPHELARELTNKLTAAAVATISVKYSDATGEYTISTDGATLNLLWSTGTNTATTIGAIIGFIVSSDDSGSTSYIADNAISFDPAVTPEYDTGDSVIVRSSQLLIGDYNNNICRAVTDATFTIGTPKSDFLSVCSDSGIDSSVTNERSVTFTCNLKLSKYDVGLYDKYKNNETTSIAFTSGAKSAGNWVAGSVINVYMGNATITSHPIAESDGVVIISLEARGFVNSSRKDAYLNFL